MPIVMVLRLKMQKKMLPTADRCLDETCGFCWAFRLHPHCSSENFPWTSVVEGYGCVPWSFGEGSRSEDSNPIWCAPILVHLSKASNSKTTWFAGCESLLQCVYQFQAISWLFMRRGGQQKISRWFPERYVVSSSSKSPLCQRLPRPSSYCRGNAETVGWIGSGLRWELAPSWIFLTNRYIVLNFWNILTTLTT